MYISVPYARGSLLAGKLQAIAGLLTARCVTFAGDSPLEEAGFELSVPPLDAQRKRLSNPPLA